MKASKLDAGYTPNARTKLCRTCDHYSSGTCTKVQGPINPSATCKKFYEPRQGR